MKLANSSLNTIWRYNDLYKRKIEKENQCFLQENPTPLEKFNEIWLKREDMSVTGSHKFRPISYQLACLKADGSQYATISSSGNAAITLAQVADQVPAKIKIFISPNTPQAKKTALNKAKSNNCEIFESKRAPRFSNYFAAKKGADQLRASKDDNAIEGYKSLGFELFEQNSDLDAIFFFLSSGASLLGTYHAYKRLLEDGEIQKMPALHAVIASAQEEGSLAGVCARSKMRREKEIMKAINETGGATWTVSNQELEEAQLALEQAEIQSSYESLSAYIACKKAMESNDYSNPVVIFSGKKWDASGEIDETNSTTGFQQIESFEDMDELIKRDA